MVDMKRVLLTATLVASVGFVDSALADSKKNLAPGQTNSNPGQGFNDRRTLGTDALSPGQQYKQQRDLGAAPPGQGVDNFGRSKRTEP